MNANKLISAGVKAGGAVACGFGAFVSFATLPPPGSAHENIIIATGTGLATSSAILATQSIKDVIAAFSNKRERE